MAILADKEREIEAVRDRLHLLVAQKQGDFADGEVAALSSQLDRLIVEYELATIRQVKGREKTEV
ncbi:aspartyl-phosphate phosphatase Spo0E family protein [Sporomusa aerivorans]|uniref:aspartyl-phosphate phosphatase Spo0E family protein n=1 Tax=Sporomusa aerivorans TaxID=204936 RepID=UPI00352A24E3